MSVYPKNETLPDGSVYPGVDASGKFTDGDASKGVKASHLPAGTVNLILDNLEAIIRGALKKSDSTGAGQLNAAVKKLLSNHASLTGSSAHGATSAATAGQIVVRDAHGRAQVAAPAAPADIARKDTVDGHAGLNATAAVAVHGIRQGAGNGFDSDMLDGKHLDDVLRLAWTIGSVYIQFPGERSPQGLLPGTWTKMVFSKGYFFRVEGAGARAFDNVEQLGQVAQHHHAISVPGAGNFRWGALPGYQQANGFKPFNTTRHTGHVLGTTAGSDTRPINKTIRIWKRSS